MAKVYSEDVLERVRTRRYKATRRLRAREAATDKVARALNVLIADGAPEEFDGEEASAFISTLKNHRLRMIGYSSPASPAGMDIGAPNPLAPIPNYDQCEWDTRYSKEDFAELRRLGYGVADWRL